MPYSLLLSFYFSCACFMLPDKKLQGQCGTLTVIDKGVSGLQCKTKYLE